jgi:hypothetical protein
MIVQKVLKMPELILADGGEVFARQWRVGRLSFNQVQCSLILTDY